MSDAMLFGVGLAVFVLLLIGVGLTIAEFRRLPRYQEPRYDTVAPQAHPDAPRADES